MKQDTGKIFGSGSLADTPSYLFRLPLPPSVNNDKWVHNGRIIKKNSVRKWKEEAAYLLLDIPRQIEEKDWSLNINFVFHYVKSKKRIDTDNRIKPVIDAIAMRIGIDDSRLISYQVTKTNKQVSSKKDDFLYGDITFL